MSTKITDLDKFLDEIWHPYWPSHPDCGPRQKTNGWGDSYPENYRQGLERMVRKRHTLNETLQQLRDLEGTDWHRMVIDRLAKIGFRFPKYIQHPLVGYIEHHTLIAANRGGRS